MILMWILITLLAIAIAALIIFTVVCIVRVMNIIIVRYEFLEDMDKIIKMIKYQQRILADYKIFFKCSVQRSNFSEKIVPVYKQIIEAYSDLDYCAEMARLNKDYAADLKLSYEQNLSTINHYLLEYNALNCMYERSKDEAYIFSNWFPTYPFLDDSIDFNEDHGIVGTGVMIM